MSTQTNNITPMKMTAKEFRDGGYLSEVNRRFLHPLGLAMFVDEEENVFGVYDDREDLEGFYMGETIIEEVTRKAYMVDAEMNKRRVARMQSLGYIIQPVEGLA